MSKCPKCKEKLSIFYFKTICPKCGCNLMYYDMDNRLEEDAKRAEQEWERLEKLIDKVTPKFIKNKKNKEQITE